eukprot:ANDGO_08372.mRNA.1 Protein PHOTOPERIOD-INDEPENDENT EARLY FLOWERING 1
MSASGGEGPSSEAGGPVPLKPDLEDKALIPGQQVTALHSAPAVAVAVADDTDDADAGDRGRDRDHDVEMADVEPSKSGLDVRATLRNALEAVRRELGYYGESTKLTDRVRSSIPTRPLLEYAGPVLHSAIPMFPHAIRKRIRTSDEDALLAMEQDLLNRRQQMMDQGVWLPAAKRALTAEAASLIKRNKTHWDHLLDEMAWMAADFSRERKFKTGHARKLGKMIMRYHSSADARVARRRQEEERRLRGIASKCARIVKQFWGKAESVAQIKFKEEVDLKKKEVARRRQDVLLRKTEHFAALVSENMHPAAVEESADAAAAANTLNGTELADTTPVEHAEGAAEVGHEGASHRQSRTSSQAGCDEVGDYVAPAEEEDDDERTIEKDEAAMGIKEAADYADEAAALALEADMPIEKLLEMYAENMPDSGDDASIVEDTEQENTDEEDAVEESAAAEVDEESREEAAESGGAGNEIEDGEDANADVDMDMDMGMASPRGSQTTVEDFESISQQASSASNSKLLLSSSSGKLPRVVPGTSVLLNPALSLREYQCSGVRWLLNLYEHKLNGILADEMGLGKTIQTITLFAHLAESFADWGPHLIVVPSSVLLSWEMEFKRWAPGLKVMTYFGTQKERKLARAGWSRTNAFHVCLTSYSIALQDATLLRRKRWHYLVLDEAHHIKNFLSKRWQTLLAFRAEHRLLLTGTPLQNSLLELWSLLHFLMPHMFSSHTEFQQWFKLTASGEGQQQESEMVKRLHKLLSPFLLRRLKRDVEQQMPKKVEHLVYAGLSKRQMVLYEEFMSRSETRKEILEKQSMMGMMNVLMQLRKVCNHPDLFESRPIMSALDIPFLGSQYTLATTLSKYEKFLFDTLDSTKSLSWLPPLGTAMFGTNVVGVEEYQKRDSQGDSKLLESQPWLGSLETSEFKLISGLFHNRRTLSCAATGRFINKLSVLRSSMQDGARKVIDSFVVDRLSFLVAGRSRTQETDFVRRVRLEVFENMIAEGTMYDGTFVIPAVRVAHVPTSPLFSPLHLPVHEYFGRSLDASTDGMDPGQQLAIQYTSIAAARQKLFFPDRRLLQFDCGKLQALAMLLRSLYMSRPRHKVLLFTQMSKMIDVLEEFLDMHGYVHLRLDGSTKPEQRLLLMERFNRDPNVFVFLLSTRAGGVGMNLTGADTVIFYDTDWNPAMDAQAQDRCHRIGQTREVHIYRLLTKRTVEESVLRRAMEKRAMAFKVLRDDVRRFDHTSTAVEVDDVVVDEDVSSAFYARNIMHDLRDVFQQECKEWLHVSAPPLEHASASDVDAQVRQDTLLADGDGDRRFNSLEDDEDRKARETLERELECDVREFDENDPKDQPNQDATASRSTAATDASVGVGGAQDIDALLTGVTRFAVKYIESTDDRFVHKTDIWMLENQALREEAALENALRDWRADQFSQQHDPGLDEPDSDAEDDEPSFF